MDLTPIYTEMIMNADTLTAPADVDATTTPPLELSLLDMCDMGEAAQALVAVRLSSGGELRFCGHHYAANEVALAAVAAEVVDNRESANQKPE